MTFRLITQKFNSGLSGSDMNEAKIYVNPYHDPTLSGYRLVRRDRDKNNQRDSKGFFVMY